MICEKIEMANLVEEKVCFVSPAISNVFLFRILQSLDETVRGANGFGSSGGFSHVPNGSSH